MANLRQRAVVKPVKSPAKRTSSRSTGAAKEQYEEVKIDSDGSSEEILLDDDDEEEPISKNGSDILDGYASDNQIKSSSSSDDDISIDSESDATEILGDESEDDKEIRRIIEKTEAETRNMPLTARQRAKLEGGIQDPLLIESNNQHQGTDVISNEQSLKLSEKSRRRKLQRAQKIEETKRATIDRLLQKQKKTPAAPSADEDAAIKEAERVAKEGESILKPGIIRYIDRPDETVLLFPDDSTFNNIIADFSPKPLLNSDRYCQICKANNSKYIHPANGKFFCNLSCYKLIK